MRFLARLRMTPAQRQLKDPAAFDGGQPRKALLEEIANCGWDHERVAAMNRSAKELGAGPELTIREVERAARSSAFTRDTNPHRCAQEALIHHALGDDGLLMLMIRRANRIADGVQPGAKAMLGDAF